MVEVAWTGPARDDLQEIREFIARDSPRYADLTVERILGQVARLAQFPESGTRPPEFPEGPIREVVVGAYRVLYRYPGDQGRVVIITALHGSRRLPPLPDVP